MSDKEIKEFIKINPLLVSKHGIAKSTANKVGNGARLNKDEAKKVREALHWLGAKLNKITEQSLMK